jgi:hypothetical protein
MSGLLLHPAGHSDIILMEPEEEIQVSLILSPPQGM